MPVKIEYRLGVQAPAEVIWGLIADIDAWPSWNPLYSRAQGTVRIGAPVSLEMNLPGHPPRQIDCAVLDWVPNDQLHLRSTALGGLVRSIRYIEIETMAGSGCIFSNGELFAGWLGPQVARRRRRELRAGFTAMGEALRVRAEAIARGEIADGQ